MAARSTFTTGLAALAATLVLTGAATAADMALRGSLPGYEDRSNWTGVYVGVAYGYSAATVNPTNVENAFVSAYTGLYPGNAFLYNQTPVGGMDSRGAFAIFGGYQAQYEDAVLGFEMDYTALGSNRVVDRFAADGSVITLVPSVLGPAGTYDFTDQTLRTQLRVRDYMTFRMRAGWDLGNFMPFMTAGLAVGRGTEMGTLTANVCPAGCTTAMPVSMTYQKNITTGGIAYGAGLDVRIGHHVLLRGEYQGVTFARFGSGNSTVHTVRAGVGLKY